jgi:hypothetical protein
MSEPVLEGVARLRVIPKLATLRVDLMTLRLLLEYLGERAVIGTTELSRIGLAREALLLSLEDGEHLTLLILEHTLCHWDATREPLDQLYSRACQWLMEPRASNERSVDPMNAARTRIR